MDSDLLTFHTPKDENAVDVQATPSVTIEFAYAYFTLVRKPHLQVLFWHKQLEQHDPDLAEQLREFWQEDGVGLDLFPLVSNNGYTFDTSVGRFLDDLEQHLPIFRQQLAQYKIGLQHKDPEKIKKELASCEALEQRLERLANKKFRSQFVGLLRRLWAFLEPQWESQGLSASRAACQQFMEQFALHQDILAALPTHHFVQFENSRQYIKKAMQQGTVLVFPLYFALGGGFSIDSGNQHLIGYGIRSEDTHQALSEASAQLAMQLKTLADPTRLMLMTMLQRYSHFEMSVSDFAEQLGVTQPTISGHLKLLRESGLVTLEKKGNKALYKLEAETLKQLVHDLKAQFGFNENH
jgi:ArsR family transcriptional regulator, arsenate/arsenite/antimonite-responsive transcriptional repressor